MRGAEAVRRSRDDEDVRVNSHTTVWGIWWSDGAWGYACCHSTTKNSYCTGAAGEAAAASVAGAMAANLAAKAARADAEAAARAASTLDNSHLERGAGTWGDAAPPADALLDEDKVAAAMARLERAEAAVDAAGGDERKRKYNAIRHGRRRGSEDGDGSGSEDGSDGGDGNGVSAEEMEAYRRRKARHDDPAAAPGVAGASGTTGYDLL